MTNLRTLLWIYLWLLIFEGALRKWVIPSLDAPLLIVRDPLVMWIYFVAVQRGISFQNPFFMPNLVLAACTGVLSLLTGVGGIPVTIYGLRTDFLQIPLIFLIPQILDRDDVIRMGRFILYMSLPIAVLVLVQFKSSPDSFVNKGAFHTHYGTVRPSGTFSFIPGLVAYFSLVASFLFYGYLRTGVYKIWLVAVVTFMLLLSSAVSGSRSCLVSVGIVAAIAVLCVVTRGKGGMGLMIAAVVIVVLLPILSTMEVFQEGAEQLTRRFDDAGNVEGGAKGFVGRYAGSMFNHLSATSDTPLFGYGIGAGTNAGMNMLPPGVDLSWPEDEWGRLMFEAGPFFGLLLCLFRVALVLVIGRRAYEAFRHDNLLPILIFAGCGLLILNGQWGVPTTLGFAIFGAGLVLAACVDPPEEEHHDDDEHEHAEPHEADHSAPAETET